MPPGWQFISAPENARFDLILLQSFRTWLRGSSCGGNFPDHLVGREYLSKQELEGGARRLLQVGTREISDIEGCSTVAKEKHAKIANRGLAGSCFTTDIGCNPSDDNAVDPVRTWINSRSVP